MSGDPDEFDELSRLLARDGLLEESRALDTLLHHVAWTTGSELLGAVGLEMKRIRRLRWSEMGGETRRAWKRCACRVRKGWPSFPFW